MIENLNDLRLRQIQVNPVPVRPQATTKQKSTTFDKMLRERMEQAESLQFFQTFQRTYGTAWH